MGFLAGSSEHEAWHDFQSVLTLVGGKWIRSELSLWSAPDIPQSQTEAESRDSPSMLASL